jgi:hypothetical protein
MTVSYSRPFVGWKFILAHIECWSEVVDVYVDNNMYLPLPNTRFTYSAVLLRLTLIRFAYGWTNLLGFLFAFLVF